MISSSQVQSKARAVNTCYKELSTAKDRSSGFAFNSTSWWISEAGKGFRSSYADIDTDVGRLLGKISELETRTKGLSTNIQRAENEREIEKQKKLAAANNKKTATRR